MQEARFSRPASPKPGPPEVPQPTPEPPGPPAPPPKPEPGPPVPPPQAPQDDADDGPVATGDSRDEPYIPPGWSYNPASWPQRLPIVGLAVVGFAIAMYLALYQWRLVGTVWEPFFGDDSRRILRESWVSQLLPFPDAFLGALGYLADAIAGVIGGRGRWRSMPWIVVVFGILVGPLGIISIMLVVFQPVLFDAWCTLCLASAVVSVVMIGPAMDEFLASLQHLKRVRDSGQSTWRAFWGLNPQLATNN